ncbi:MAG: hypothetical protein E7167_04260 [Firmicutes bacterium]|nr:hypothetical protein [Bacillota bacterium]
MKNKSDKNFFVEIWQNQRTRSAIFLLFWVIFIGYVIINYAVPYERNKANNTTNDLVEDNPVEEDGSIYFEDLKNSLQRYNFDYVYTITTPLEKVIYKGTMLGNETVGYKESAMGIEKYYVKGVQIYKDVLGEKVLVTDKDVNVYNGLLSVDKIIELINNNEYTQSDNEYNFQIEALCVKISVAHENIAKIEIIDGNNNYLLEFSNVNEVEELNY